ncbi:molybdenum ABC transporter ATP-binding protein [Emcibacter nanhaiensis]|uniref:Molybdenum ABC transporter ATP-binding protein n=1 Tax=Emcibacter nanhaiensis TaxID=1505037 RepID=A0A501PAK5_9PROT|nr:molybdenum ABC transporter ATP-binding protein [Emcibacter nanhaiensis]TPD57265.1 molybdenum ABC transporter ATP-binding protein [Emcibacter nanhaiensis]
MTMAPVIQSCFRLDRGQAGEFQLDVDLRLPGQGVSVLFGPSGSGKTTLLRCMAGLERVPGGVMRLSDRVWQDGNIFIPVHKRKVGYVFQEANLFPHLTARGNINYALRRSATTAEKDEFEKVISLLGLSRFMDRYPAALSGGEKQRVAIARALLIRPDLLLMDEPLAALDQGRKQEILPYLEHLREELSLPVVYVTHSLQELTRLANHVVVLEEGRVKTEGSFHSVLQDLSGLTGEPGEDVGTIIEGSVVEREPEWQLMTVAFPGGRLCVQDREGTEDVRLRVLARDVSIALGNQTDSSILNRLPAEIDKIETRPDEALAMVYLKAGETILLARLTRRSVAELGLAAGMKVWAQIKSVAVVQ